MVLDGYIINLSYIFYRIFFNINSECLEFKMSICNDECYFSCSILDANNPKQAVFSLKNIFNELLQRKSIQQNEVVLQIFL